jgi:hypothetical protein
LIFLELDDFEHAFDLMKEVEPTQTTEYILKGVVHAIYGQEHNSVYSLIEKSLSISLYSSLSILKSPNLIFKPLVIHLMNVVSRIQRHNMKF